MLLDGLLTLAFTTASFLKELNLTQHSLTRRPILQKVRRHPEGLRLIVSIRFQVLFHYPPGVLFTFPSRYSSLSVTGVYLALDGGPPRFTQDSTCPALLRILLEEAIHFKYRTFTFSGWLFQNHSSINNFFTLESYNP